MKVTAIIKALPGQMVMVKNYRKSNQWEEGQVISSEIHVNHEGKSKPRYDVYVRREPSHPRGKFGYHLTVGDESITKK